jgi:hypothetical protein
MKVTTIYADDEARDSAKFASLQTHYSELK